MEDIKSTEVEFIKAEKTALVVIDLQNGIVNMPHYPFDSTQVVQNASNLINAFTEKGAFVVLVKVSSVDGKDMLKPKTDLKSKPLELSKGWDNFLPELEGVKNAHVITKRQWGAFYGTDL
ncbi:MAG TPA: isochorismatase family protein, partial [Clostridia bacterium]